jgi:hypothetical protein
MDRTAARRVTVLAGAGGLMTALLLPGPALSRETLAQVDVYDRTLHQALPAHHKLGRSWIVGEPGHEYSVRVRNCTGARVLAVISVDGVNVITGQTASPAQAGYVIEPGDYVTVEGWRKSLDRTAAFVFTDPSDSYAARTGRPNDLGVIGVALFRERQSPVVAQEPDTRLYGSPADGRDAASPAARAEAGEAKSRADAAERSASLGTGHGRSEHSPAQWTSFDRASDKPDEAISIRYETRSALVAMGVLPGWRPPGRDPEPFPGRLGQLGFVPDP